MIALNETNEYAAEVPFTLPLATDPLTGLTGHTFTLGEVQIKLPGSLVWVNVAVNKIVEKGYGRFCARLTSAQTTTEGLVAIRASVTGTQPYFGSETIGVLGGDIPINGAGYITFFLPDEFDPVYGSPIDTADFTSSGTLRVCLPDAAYRDCTPTEKASVVNLGFGGYALPIDVSLTPKAGKIFIYASYTGAQRFEDYSVILGTGVAPTEIIVGPDPIAVPTPATSPTSTLMDLIGNSINRLCEYSRSGNFIPDVFVDTVGIPPGIPDTQLATSITVPIEVPITETSPPATTMDLLTNAVNRLCEYSKSGNYAG